MIVTILKQTRAVTGHGSRLIFGALLMTLLAATPSSGSPAADRSNTKAKKKGALMKSHTAAAKKITGYAPVNGLKMYYEIEGSGDPLVFIPPAFGFAGLECFPS